MREREGEGAELELDGQSEGEKDKERAEEILTYEEFHYLIAKHPPSLSVLSFAKSRNSAF